MVVAAVFVARSLLGTLRGRDPVASLAAGMATVALLAVQTQPWYLLWALAPAAATDRPRLHALLGWGCVVLATLVPPTGGDFLLRGYQLTHAITAAALLLLAWAGIGRFHRLRRAGVPTAPGATSRAEHRVSASIEHWSHSGAHTVAATDASRAAEKPKGPRAPQESAEVEVPFCPLTGRADGRAASGQSHGPADGVRWTRGAGYERRW